MFVKYTQDDDIWMEFPIQHGLYTFELIIPFQVILNFIPIFWNMLIWLKYDLMHHISLYFDI